MSERAVHVANVSGFFGDRLAAARETVDAHREGRVHVDVLTGDWLAELTMGLLAKQRDKDPGAGDAAKRSSTPGGGYASTFVTQMSDVLADCLAAGIRVVANAGGLDPSGCAAAIEALGTGARVAFVEGDDVTEVVAARDDLVHLETGEPLPGRPTVANAYLGCRGIVAALGAGADVVVTGRVTDAAVVIGPAAWWHGWSPDDLDALAGATAAGHVIECGAQATGGNFSFSAEFDGMAHVGLPVAEIASDGSAVITKAAGTGGGVTVETVTAQLLYEIDGSAYLTPDVVTHVDSLALTAEGPDRVRISGTRGSPPPPTVKAGAILPGGWRNELTFVLTGTDIEAKAALAQETLWASVPGGRDAFDDVAVRLVRGDREDPARMTDAVALLTVAVAGEKRAVGRFSRAAVEGALAGYPGFFATTPPGPGSAANVFWPVLLPAEDLPQRVTFEGTSWDVPPPVPTERHHRPVEPTEGALRSGTVGAPVPTERHERAGEPAGGALRSGTVRVPLGRVVGARSGDKGGNATLGLWARDDGAHAWLAAWWTPEHVAALLGEDAAGCALRLWSLPNVRAVGVTVVGFLGLGVADNLLLDAQAKGLGEFVRARHVDLPEELVR